MEEQEPSQRSRRDFLEKIGAAAALTGAAVTGAALGIFPEAHAQSPGQQPIPDPPTWPETDPNFAGSPSEEFIVSGSPFYNAIVTEGGTQPDSPDSLHRRPIEPRRCASSDTALPNLYPEPEHPCRSRGRALERPLAARFSAVTHAHPLHLLDRSLQPNHPKPSRKRMVFHELLRGRLQLLSVSLGHGYRSVHPAKQDV